MKEFIIKDLSLPSYLRRVLLKELQIDVNDPISKLQEMTDDRLLDTMGIREKSVGYIRANIVRVQEDFTSLEYGYIMRPHLFFDGLKDFYEAIEEVRHKKRERYGIINPRVKQD